MPTGITGVKFSQPYQTFYVVNDDSNNSYMSKGNGMVLMPAPTVNAWTFGTTCQNMIYYGGGIGDLTTWQQYSPISNTWTSKATLLTGCENSTCTSVNGKVYVMGGYTGNQAADTAAVQEYNPVTDSWTAKGNMPAAVGECGVATYKNIIYVIGGFSQVNSYTNAVYSYEPLSDIWTLLAPVPSGNTGINELGCAAIGGNIYCVSGFFAGAADGKVYRYNIATNTWTMMSNYPLVAQLVGVTIVDEVIYGMGGSVGGTSKNNIYRYNQVNDSWTQLNFNLTGIAAAPVVYAASPSPSLGG